MARFWMASVVMAPRDFEAAWAPLIGKDGAVELRRYRKLSMARPLVAFLAAGAGALIGRGGAGNVIGIICGVAAVGLVGAYIRAQWRTTRAIGAWFGVKRLGWNLRWTPQRFDESRKRRGLMTPDERLAAAMATDHSDE